MVRKASPRSKRTAPRLKKQSGPGKKSARKSSTGKLPGVEFRYSWVYDHENKLRFTDPLYPSGDKIRQYIEDISGEWKPRQRTILSSISRISGLPWREQNIVCYVVGRGIPMSDPLTMPLYEDQPEAFLEKMTYQLVERMVMHPQNLKSQSVFWEAMFRAMAEDGIKVSYMVPVNAIFREIQSKHFKTGSEGKSLISKTLDYRRAWEIVDSLGTSRIIERFRRGEWD